MHAQNERTITIRILDARTARPIVTSNFLVQINHMETIHADWVQSAESGPGKLTLPANATVISIHATYDSAMRTYVNCDSVGKKEGPGEHWYAVSAILASGVVAPNGCSRMTETAKPGEFIFFVRKENWRETMNGDYSPP